MNQLLKLLNKESLSIALFLSPCHTSATRQTLFFSCTSSLRIILLKLRQLLVQLVDGLDFVSLVHQTSRLNKVLLRLLVVLVLGRLEAILHGLLLNLLLLLLCILLVAQLGDGGRADEFNVPLRMVTLLRCLLLLLLQDELLEDAPQIVDLV